MNKIFIINGVTESGKDLFMDEVGKVVEIDKWSAKDFFFTDINNLERLNLCLSSDDKHNWVKDMVSCDFLEFLLELKSNRKFVSDGIDNYLKKGIIQKRIFELIDIWCLKKPLFICSRNHKLNFELKEKYDAQLIYIKRDEAMKKPMPSDADERAKTGFENYDLILTNNGTEEEFKEKAREFAKEYLKE